MRKIFGLICDNGKWHIRYNSELYSNQMIIENKLTICALGNLDYKISIEKIEPEPGFEPRTSGFLARHSTT